MMTAPEIDDERRSRDLRELEGKNIAHYSVVLRVVIESELDGIKQIIAISSAGIGLQYALDRFPSGSVLLCLSLGLSIFSILGFGTAIVCGIRFLLAASKRYEEELRGTTNLSGYQRLLDARKIFSWWRRAAILAFQVGVLSLGGLVIMRAAIGASTKQPNDSQKPPTASVMVPSVGNSGDALLIPVICHEITAGCGGGTLPQPRGLFAPGSARNRIPHLYAVCTSSRVSHAADASACCTSSGSRSG